MSVEGVGQGGEPMWWGGPPRPTDVSDPSDVHRGQVEGRRRLKPGATGHCAGCDITKRLYWPTDDALFCSMSCAAYRALESALVLTASKRQR